MDLKGKSAIVTGGSSGIGAAIARKLGSLGANVAINYWSSNVATNNSQDDINAQAVVKDITNMGVKGLAIKTDVSNFNDAHDMVNKVVETFGGLHILVCNAGINWDGVIWKMTEAQWDKVVDVNLKGYFNYAHAAIPFFREQQYGKIVNISSINGLRGKFGQSNYTASKGGVISLTKTMARELGNKNINVNAIAPGLIETEMVSKMPEEAKQKSLKEIVMGRLGQPEEVANVVSFFVSDLSRHVTGQVLNVDGGQLIA